MSGRLPVPSISGKRSERNSRGGSSNRSSAARLTRASIPALSQARAVSPLARMADPEAMRMDLCHRRSPPSPGKKGRGNGILEKGQECVLRATSSSVGRHVWAVKCRLSARRPAAGSGPFVILRFDRDRAARVKRGDRRVRPRRTVLANEGTAEDAHVSS